MDKVSGFNELMGGATAATQGYADATTAGINSRLAGRSGAMASKLKKREADMATGAFTAEASNSGLMLTGSLLDQIQSSQRQGISDAVNIKMQSNIEKVNQKYAARSAIRSSIMAIGSSAIKAAPYFKTTPTQGAT